MIKTDPIAFTEPGTGAVRHLRKAFGAGPENGESYPASTEDLRRAGFVPAAELESCRMHLARAIAAATVFASDLEDLSLRNGTPTPDWREAIGCTCPLGKPSSPTMPGSAIRVGHAAGCPAIAVLALAATPVSVAAREPIELVELQPGEAPVPFRPVAYESGEPVGALVRSEWRHGRYIRANDIGRHFVDVETGATTRESHWLDADEVRKIGAPRRTAPCPSAAHHFRIVHGYACPDCGFKPIPAATDDAPENKLRRAELARDDRGNDSAHAAYLMACHLLDWAKQQARIGR